MSTQSEAAGGGAADAQAWIDGFERAGGVLVELEVRTVARDASPEVDVGLVPDFEVPLRDFVDAVAIDEVVSEGGDEGVPALEGFGRGDVGLVPEGVQRVGIEGELLRHEGDLDDGADAFFEQAVVDLVDVSEVVDGVAMLVLGVDAVFVVENAVSAEVREAGDLLDGVEVFAECSAEHEVGAAGAEHLLPEVGGRGWRGRGRRWGSAAGAWRGEAAVARSRAKTNLAVMRALLCGGFRSIEGGVWVWSNDDLGQKQRRPDAGRTPLRGVLEASRFA